MVERNLAKVEVASSRLVSRSKHQGEVKTCRFAFPFDFFDSDSLESSSLESSSFDPPFVRAASVGRSYQPHWRGGRVVMQRPAKPWTPVRFRPPPPINQCFTYRSLGCKVAQSGLQSPLDTRIVWFDTRVTARLAVYANPAIGAPYPIRVEIRLGNDGDTAKARKHLALRRST